VDLTEADLTGRRLAHFMWDELEKIAQAGMGGASAPEAGGQQAAAGELEGAIQREAEGEEEASPAHGVVAARVEQLDDKKARGTPVIQPPPGFVYAPELQAFVPDQSNPGWMQAEEAAEAAKAKSFYDQGQSDLQNQQAQAELDQRAEAETQQAVAEQQMAAQQQMQQQIQQQATADATTKAVAKEQAKSVASNLKTPDSVTGKKSEGSKSSGDKPKGKGVTINVGK
jgi:hypothetical protein